jgi:hypothetical protein
MNTFSSSNVRVSCHERAFTREVPVPVPVPMPVFIHVHPLHTMRGTALAREADNIAAEGANG